MTCIDGQQLVFDWSNFAVTKIESQYEDYLTTASMLVSFVIKHTSSTSLASFATGSEYARIFSNLSGAGNKTNSTSSPQNNDEQKSTVCCNTSQIKLYVFMHTLAFCKAPVTSVCRKATQVRTEHLRSRYFTKCIHKDFFYLQ